MKSLEEESNIINAQRDADKKAIYESGVPQARRVQADLLEELRSMGIVGMIEDFIEEPILPLRDASGSYLVREPTADEFERGKRADRTRGERQWFLADVPEPSMLNDGAADPTLRIILAKWYMVPREIGMRPVSEVEIEYDKFRGLRVFGKEETLKTFIYMRNPEEYKEIVERGIARAIYEPKPLLRNE